MGETATHRSRFEEPEPLEYPSSRSFGKIRTLVVGRAPLETNSLQSILSELTSVEIVGSAESIPSAVRLIERLSPELIVLDSRAPVEMALEILDREDVRGKVIVGSILCGIGFRAFDVHRHQSLLDPPSGAVGNMHEPEEDGGEESSFHSNERRLKIDDPIILKLNARYYVVRVRSILTILAARHFTYVSTVEGYKGIASRSMREWFDRLPADTFARIHRNAMVNLEYIERIEETSHSSYDIFLKGRERPIPMSGRCFARMKRQLN